jgi:hypothetical protein
MIAVRIWETVLIKYHKSKDKWLIQDDKYLTTGKYGIYINIISIKIPLLINVMQYSPDV